MARGRPPKSPVEMPNIDDVQPTRELDAEEAAAWERWRAVVAATRRFLPTDGPLLTCVVELEVRKSRARATLATQDNYPEGKRHPALTDLDSAHRDLVALLRELGLTPASFKNVKAERRSKEADKLGEFIAGD